MAISLILDTFVEHHIFISRIKLWPDTVNGMADFAHLRLNNMQTWEISMHDISPQTFSSSIITMDVGELERPSPGTYSIGDGINTGFSGIFIDVVDGAFHLSEEYATLESDDFGTLTITSSNENNVKGHFEFTALLTDMDDSYNTVILKTIHVQGEFSANKRKY